MARPATAWLREGSRRHARHQQVHVIGHQHVTVDGAAVFGGRSHEQSWMAHIILFAEEDRLAIG